MRSIVSPTLDPFKRDVNRLVRFIFKRRRRVPNALATCRRLLPGRDAEAVAFLCDAIEHHGAYSMAEYRLMARLRAALDPEISKEEKHA